MPEYLALFTKMFIALASIMGIVVALKGQDVMESASLRTSLVFIFAVAFMGCAATVLPYILLDFDLSLEQIWFICSIIALALAIAWLPLLYKAQKKLSQRNKRGRLILRVNIVANLVFAVWFAVNISYFFGPPDSAPLGVYMLYIFCQNSYAFVTVVMARPRPQRDE